MEVSRDFAPTEDTAHGHGRSRRRPVNACSTCRARKVKCDERPNGCLNCERLQLNCVQQPANGGTVVLDTSAGARAITGIKRKRTFRVCVPCRQSKIKCSGERPICSRCRQRSATCLYDAEVAEPAWVQSIAPSTPSQPSPRNMSMASASPTPPWNDALPQPSSPLVPNCPPSLTWLFTSGLPPKAKLRNLLEFYFDSVHPVRVFAFVHRPSFMRMLEEGLLTDRSDHALLYIMCALGARFFALEYSESTALLPRELIQRAGSQWAKIAEQMYFAEYSTISTTKLKVLVLLHDHEARTGNYAASFLLTGLIIRMAHALQINQEVSADILCKEEIDGPHEVSLREARRRLMWACYVVDVWAGSGVAQLTILNERDIKLQLPCNERQFLLQIPTITERLQPGKVLDIIAPEDIPERPRDNMGMSAYYVRIIYIWQRVLRYVKHVDEVKQPWAPGAEFTTLVDEIAAWKASHPSWLEFSSDNIYIRRASSQLGALFLVHCMYHHVLCDLHRISLPNLFKISEPFVFPPEQFPFMAKLQTTCFEHAQQVSILTTATLQHGVRYLADAIVPSLVYNSSRIMLYYTARILDRTKPDAPMIIKRTIELIEQNNQALREMSQLYPIAEPLYVTTEEWLDKVRESIARGDALQYIAPPDPSAPNGGEAPNIRRSTSSTSNRAEPSADRPLPAMPAFGASKLPISQNATPNLASSSIPSYNSYITSNEYPYDMVPAPEPIQPDPQSILMPIPSGPSPSQADQLGPVYYPGMENLEQPIFDLNDLQNFFEWENAEAEPPPTGVEGLGPLGWNGLSNMQ